MAIVTTDDKYYKEIAQKFRDIALETGEHYVHFGFLDKKYKPSEIAEAIQQTYDAALDFKKEEYIERGKQDEYDAFWDVFQKKGDAAGVNYYYAFAYSDRFTDENYNPKYDIICASGNSPGMALFYANEAITDTKVPIRVLGNTAQSMFYSCTKLRRIPLLQVNENVTFQSTFGACSALEKLDIAGTIGKDIDLGSCPKLSGGSFESVVTALSDTVSGCTATFSQKAYDSDTSGYWMTIWKHLVSTKTNWTITLV